MGRFPLRRRGLVRKMELEGLRLAKALWFLVGIEVIQVAEVETHIIF